jgi:phage FluMu protein Com
MRSNRHSQHRHSSRTSLTQRAQSSNVNESDNARRNGDVYTLSDNDVAASRSSSDSEKWARQYAYERAQTPATPVVQNLLVARDDIASRSEIRSRRAQSGVMCPDCGLVGYFRVNCPKCQTSNPVKINVDTNTFRPATPESLRLLAKNKKDLHDPVKQFEAFDFKKTSAVPTKTGLGGAAWFWKKKDVVWQYDDESLPPEPRDSFKSDPTFPFDPSKATVEQVISLKSFHH